jgi:hypothetical protein
MSLMKPPARRVFSTFDWSGCLLAAMNRSGGFSRRRLKAPLRIMALLKRHSGRLLFRRDDQRPNG